MKDEFKNTELIVLSNREPYIHEDQDAVRSPAGGLTAALDQVLQQQSGTWIAWGSGDADFTVTTDQSVSVPPDNPSYILKRVKLSDEEIAKYYYGYSNQVLWPICHQLLSRVNVNPGYWETYQTVNQRFAAATAETMTDQTEVIWVQDYHLALVPKFLDEYTEEVTVQHFWHIPWPPDSVFRRIPESVMLLHGLLATDRIGFHTEQYRTSFIDTVREDEVDVTVHSNGQIESRYGTTETYVSPVGVDQTEIESSVGTEGSRMFQTALRGNHRITDAETIIVAVDRLDYTKGILHRLRTIEHLLETHPELHGKVRLLQKGTLTREQIPAYRQHQQQIRETINRINDRFRTDDWQPIIYREQTDPRSKVLGLLSMGDLCMVTPVADGLNLTALEYVFARGKATPGKLMLSKYAGVSEYLDGVYTVNPHDIPGTTEQLATALTATDVDQKQRWNRLYDTATNLDIVDWIEDGNLP